jgi:cell division protease FtsH
MNDNKKDTKAPPGGRLPGGVMMLLIAVALVILLNMVINSLSGGQTQLITYSEFVTLVKEGKVERVEILTDRFQIFLKDEPVANEPTPAPGLSNLDRLALGTNQQFIDMQRQASQIMYTGLLNDPELLDLLNEYGVDYTAIIPESNWLPYVLINFVLPIIFIIGMFTLVRRYMSNMMGGGRGGFM